MNGERSGYLSEYRARINRALAYARLHADGNPGLRELAEAAAFSPFHFHRIFSALTGETPADHVRRLRLEKAANRLLYSPEKPVTQIALESGFATPSSFARDFRLRFGMSPSSFRRRNVSVDTDFPPPFAPVGTRSEPGTESDRFVDFPPLVLAYISVMGSYGTGIGHAWGDLARWANGRGISVSLSTMFGISWDNPDITPDRRQRYDVCVAAPPGTQPGGEVGIHEFPASRCLAYSYEGPEKGLTDAFRRLYHGILPASGCEPDDIPAFERYFAPPRGFPEKRIVMEILLPVRPLS